jgi:hypothetical protein
MKVYFGKFKGQKGFGNILFQRVKITRQILLNPLDYTFVYGLGHI